MRMKASLLIVMAFSNFSTDYMSSNMVKWCLHYKTFCYPQKFSTNSEGLHSKLPQLGQLYMNIEQMASGYTWMFELHHKQNLTPKPYSIILHIHMPWSSAFISHQWRFISNFHCVTKEFCSSLLIHWGPSCMHTTNNNQNHQQTTTKKRNV